MSSWTDDKTPLLPPSAQAFLRRRGAEVTGLGFAAIGAAFLAILVTFNPADPSWFNATSDAPRNILGAAGAFLADPMMRMAGLAACASVSISRDLLISQFWQNLQARLQPAVPKDNTGVPGRKCFSGFFSMGSTQKPLERP